MSSDPIITLDNVSKCYRLYEKPHERLLQVLYRGRKSYGREFWALRGVDLEVFRGEVIGLVGRNGAGKSTLLQLVCGTLAPTTGTIEVRGRVAALLELGSGFNPEFTGRENIFLSAAVIGVPHTEISARFEAIVEFSGVRDFIDQPVKTYSSGMYVRLAFSVAINVDPDILIIDEALSVGDGEFARKSFEQIMLMKDRGVTILFCSHSMYQIETLCTRAIWLKNGFPQIISDPATTILAYEKDLKGSGQREEVSSILEQTTRQTEPLCRIRKVTALIDGQEGKNLSVISGKSALSLAVEFSSAPELPCPSVAVAIKSSDGRFVTSASTFIDDHPLHRQSCGAGRAGITFAQFPLLKGTYTISVYLMCERGIYIYENAHECARLNVRQETFEQGIVILPHQWQ